MNLILLSVFFYLQCLCFLFFKSARIIAVSCTDDACGPDAAFLLLGDRVGSRVK